jgi:hypothetical protein
MHTKLVSVNVKGREHLGNIGVDGRVIFKLGIKVQV